MSSLEELKTNFASKEEIRQLAKAMATTSTANDMITVEYDPELQKKVFHKAPFLAYLEQNGLVKSAESYEVGYKVKEQKTSASFISEGADIPAHDPAGFKAEIAKMKTLVYPIEMSDLLQAGMPDYDIFTDEVQDGFLDMSQTKDITLLQGNETSNSNEFTGFFNTIPSESTTNMKGENISLDAIDIAAQTVIDNGGNPSAIITTASVGRQINKILSDKYRYLEKLELTFGVRATAYNAPDGNQIPIIIDPNINTSVNGEQLAFIDNDTVRMRELAPISLIDLAKTKLSTSKVLFTWFTFYNRAGYKNGYIKNIGSDITP
ncbi:MAG: DUF5309 family protein [Methanobacteriaceae archaeon]|jgi:hypothetical protein|nr:DUF5309 family protein [Methanobacteriaceae archaeon]MDD4594940.1 DUF5309 family protein [Methanobacteriaceae archaeon]